MHKAFVEVNEEGTEAAAATAMMMAVNSIEHTPDFIADRPFLFYIKEKAHGNILFMGRYNKPEWILLRYKLWYLIYKLFL